MEGCGGGRGGAAAAAQRPAGCRGLRQEWQVLPATHVAGIGRERCLKVGARFMQVSTWILLRSNHHHSSRFPPLRIDFIENRSSIFDNSGNVEFLSTPAVPASFKPRPIAKESSPCRVNLSVAWISIDGSAHPGPLIRENITHTLTLSNCILFRLYEASSYARPPSANRCFFSGPPSPAEPVVGQDLIFFS